MNRFMRVALAMLAVSLSGCATPPFSTSPETAGVDICALPNVSMFIQAKLRAGSGKYGNIPPFIQEFIRAPYTPADVVNDDHSAGLDCEVVLKTVHDPYLAGRVILERGAMALPETASIMFYSEQELTQAAQERRKQVAAYMRDQAQHQPIQVNVTVVPGAPQWTPPFERYHGP